MDGLQPQQNYRQPLIWHQMRVKHHSSIGTLANNLWASWQPDDGYKVVEIVDGKVNLDDDLVVEDEDFACRIDGMNVALKDY